MLNNLLQMILQNPHEKVSWEVTADYLEEQGENERDQYIRNYMELIKFFEKLHLKNHICSNCCANKHCDRKATSFMPNKLCKKSTKNLFVLEQTILIRNFSLITSSVSLPNRYKSILRKKEYVTAFEVLSKEFQQIVILNEFMVLGLYHDGLKDLNENNRKLLNKCCNKNKDKFQAIATGLVRQLYYFTQTITGSDNHKNCFIRLINAEIINKFYF